MITDSVNKKKKEVRDVFLNDFFLPLRREFERDMPKYQKLWPIKDEDMEEEPVEFEIIHTFDQTVSERKIL
jgi:hypothetical protein